MSPKSPPLSGTARYMLSAASETLGYCLTVLRGYGYRVGIPIFYFIIFMFLLKHIVSTRKSCDISRQRTHILSTRKLQILVTKNIHSVIEWSFSEFL